MCTSCLEKRIYFSLINARAVEAHIDSRFSLLKDGNLKHWPPPRRAVSHASYNISAAHVSYHPVKPEKDKWPNQREATALTISRLLLTFIGLLGETERGQRSLGIRAQSQGCTQRQLKHRMMEKQSLLLITAGRS